MTEGKDLEHDVTEKRTGAFRGRTPPGTKTIAERRRDALAAGEKTFDPGVECIHGHLDLRHTKSNACITCKREGQARANREHPEREGARWRRWAERNADHVRESCREYYQNNSATIKKRVKDWQEANPERVRAWKKDNRSRNLDARHEVEAAWRAKNRKRIREQARRWARDNPENTRANGSIRRAREQEATAGDAIALKAFYGYVKDGRALRCYWCGKQTRRTDRHVDHIIAISRGGSNDVANLCVSCRPCNLSKGAKMPAEFAGQSELKF